MKIDIYTDGACSKNGQKNAQAAWACYFPEHSSLSKAERVPETEMQTNQRGELMAIAKAVQIAEQNFDVLETELKIYSDSMYSKNCLTTWLPSWVRNNWKTSQGGDVQHRDLIEDTANRLSRFKSFNIVYVKAHTGGADEQSKCNHIVDRMAVKVLEPELDEAPKIVSNQQNPFEDCPLKLMGPPVTEQEIIQWCLSNLNKLDQSILNSALMTAFTKTVKTKGFEVTKQRLHRSNLYRLKTDTGLIKEDVTIVKEE